MNSNFRADLHCHSIYSDGSDTPSRLIQLAQESSLQGLSITDHDTITAYEEAIPVANQLKFPLLSGVEFSASHRGEAVHVLGYAFSLKHSSILHLCEKHRCRRLERNQRMIAKLRKLGFSISEEELYRGHTKTIGRPHLALLLIEKGIVRDIKEAFQRYLGEGKPAYDPGEVVSVEETIACIQAAGGKAILAHPHLLQRSTTVRDLLSMPFDGLEGFYAKMHSEQEKEWIAIGHKKGWIITGGSDYHGAIKPQIPLGCSWVGKDTFHILYDHYCAQSSL